MHDSLFQNHLEICVEDLKNFISYNLAGSILGFCPKENSKYWKGFVYQDVRHSVVYHGKQKQTTWMSNNRTVEYTMVHSFERPPYKHLKMFTMAGLGKLVK